MRVTLLSLVLLFLHLALAAQDHGSQSKEIFDWGANKQTFKVGLTIRHSEGQFTISERGLGWIQLYTNDRGTGVIPWQEVHSWYCQRGDLMILAQNRSVSMPIGFSHADLVKVVNVLTKYAPDAQDTSRACSPEE